MQVTIVAPSTSNNSLGRATALAGVVTSAGYSVVLAAFDDGPLWVGAQALASEIIGFSSVPELRSLLFGSSRKPRDHAILVVKPLAHSAGAVRSIIKSGAEGAVLWFDEDDFDEGINRYSIQHLPAWHRAVATARRPQAPWRIRRRIRWWSQRADIVSTSSHALATRLGIARRAYIRVPHTRTPGVWEPTSPTDRGLRLGFLGTPQAYKGIATIIRLMGWLPQAQLHVFEHTAEAFRSGVASERLVLHPGLVGQAVERALKDVDVVVLPQDTLVDAARYQLPAKLMDAMCHGRPVVASDTPVIREFRTSGVELIASWEDRREVMRAFRLLDSRAARHSLGVEMAANFEQSYSTVAVAHTVAHALAAAVNDCDRGVHSL